MYGLKPNRTTFKKLKAGKYASQSISLLNIQQLYICLSILNLIISRPASWHQKSLSNINTHAKDYMDNITVTFVITIILPHSIYDPQPFHFRPFWINNLLSFAYFFMFVYTSNASLKYAQHTTLNTMFSHHKTYVPFI